MPILFINHLPIEEVGTLDTKYQTILLVLFRKLNTTNTKTLYKGLV